MTSTPTSAATTSAAPSPAPPSRRPGFTLVEMLVVIGIIVILMAILLPVIAKVKTQARVATTQQEISKLSGAIEQYYLEFKVYPGLLSNGMITTGVTLPGAGSNSITSTENMVISLAGGAEVSTTGITYVSSDLAASLGPMNLSPNPMKQTRHPPFINATPGQNMPNLPWDAGSGRSGASDSDIPEFRDTFNDPRPILYLRALVGNPANSGVNVCGPNDTSTQYNYNHLSAYIMGTAGSNQDFAFAANSTPTTPGAAPYFNDWNQYLGNPNVANTPRGVGKFILISAGPDNIFGTKDDIFYP